MDLKALYNISYGIYVVSSKKEDRINGQIANTVFQTTSEPATIAVCINKENLTHEFITESKVFSVSVLEQETDMKFIGKFGFKSGRDEDKFKGVNYKIGVTGSPIIMENTLAFMEAEVIMEMDAGTHTLFVGKVVEAGNIKKAKPLTYDYYHQVKRGVSPKTAPTYIPKEEKSGKEINKEKEIYRGQVLEMGKPEKIVDKIVEGKLKKYFKENCLMNQAYVRDPDITIEDLLNEMVAKIGENITIKRFARFKIGEE